MKKKLLVIAFVIFSASLLGQTNHLLPKTLRVESPVYFDTSYNKQQMIFPMKKLKEKPFFTFITEKVLNGEVIAFENSPGNLYNLDKKPITITEIKKSMGGRDEYIMKEDSSGALIEIKIKGEIYPEQVKGGSFIDEWCFNTENFTFSKKVISYCPVLFIAIVDGKGNTSTFAKKICQLNFESLSEKEIKKSNKRLVHYATIKYEQWINNQAEYYGEKNYCSKYQMHENSLAPFLTSYGKKILAETIYNKVLAKEVKAFDFHSKKELTVDEVKARQGIKNKDKFYYKDIHSYIFTEDWYLDPLTLRIVKKVKAIAPVRYYKKKREIVFEVKFNN